jgi:hypothetical protein
VRLVSETPERAAGKAWAFRHAVERDATMRFGRLAGRLERIGTPAPLVRLAEKASKDEDRHAGYCAELAGRYAAPLLDEPPVPSEIAPSRLRARQRVLYEVAAICMAETESTAMLVTLMGAATGGPMRSLLREFSRDEVKHARFAWAVLASHKERDDLAFLGQWIPWMLRTTAGDSFKPDAKGPEDPRLLEHGVLPYSMRKQVFVRTLDDVIFPGLEALGIDSRPSRAWLAGAV